ncbi:DUF6314 family protein [Salinisphaera sp. Q1T1-3]|uniref:DUF6314 family protein n=1 Tax=Salinisphaera sp. Q1T1-3 TaxID=2321229 RepID=UPI000E71CD5C|nr:DUF6314 family protein [Salinisphaera sp. Q1T1-3]RJS94097.1 hypothetical protein D3260_05900 [Salinisphaera sp. Q1T1-3]
MSAITSMSFEATPGPRSPTGWRGHGTARVCCRTDGDVQRLIERGRFLPSGATRAFAFHNTYRWAFDETMLRLAHERFGAETPVELVELVADGPDSLIARAAHVCGADHYTARLVLVADGFDLIWSIDGPAKQEHLCYHYRAAGL